MAAAADLRARRVAEMDVFALCAELGERGQQYDAETDSMVDTFVRGEDCLECLRQLSRSLPRLPPSSHCLWRRVCV